jgi:hypothetical protein
MSATQGGILSVYKAVKILTIFIVMGKSYLYIFPFKVNNGIADLVLLHNKATESQTKNEPFRLLCAPYLFFMLYFNSRAAFSFEIIRLIRSTIAMEQADAIGLGIHPVCK